MEVFVKYIFTDDILIIISLEMLWAEGKPPGVFVTAMWLGWVQPPQQEEIFLSIKLTKASNMKDR